MSNWENNPHQTRDSTYINVSLLSVPSPQDVNLKANSAMPEEAHKEKVKLKNKRVSRKARPSKKKEIQAIRSGSMALPSLGSSARGFFVQAEVLKYSPPPYPESARQNEEEGEVVLLLKIGRNGEVIHKEIANLSGCKSLDWAALKAVDNWTFRPATLDGVRVAGELRIPVEFSLD